MLAQLNPCHAVSRQSWRLDRARRSFWRTPAGVDDSLAGPGPSSMAAAAFTSARAAPPSAWAPSEAGLPASRRQLPAPTGADHRRRAPAPARATAPSSADIAAAPMNNDTGSPAHTPPTASGRPVQQRRFRSIGSGSGSTSSKHRGPSGSPSQAAQEAVVRTAGEAAGAAGSVQGGQKAPGTGATSQPSDRPVKSILDIAAASRSGHRSQTSSRARRLASDGGAATTAAAAAAGDGDVDGETPPVGNPAAGLPLRLPDGRQLVPVKPDTVSAGAASALSQALGVEQRAVVRFDGGAGALKGLRVLTLANIFMGSFRRALSFVVDVKQVVHGKRSPLEGRPQSTDVLYMYRVRARARELEPHDQQLTTALRNARFLLDLSINVRQVWDSKGDVDEDQAYDLADTLYGALLAQQAEADAAEAAEAAHQDLGQRALATPNRPMGLKGDLASMPHHHHRQQQQQRQRQQQREWEGSPMDRKQLQPPPPWIMITADVAQGATMLTALGLLQRRLREEQQQAVAETTLYRCSVAAPRMDGKDGWVFVVRLAFEAPYWPARYVNNSFGARRSPSPPPPRSPPQGQTEAPSLESSSLV